MSALGLSPALWSGAPVARLDADDRSHREQWLDGECVCSFDLRGKPCGCSRTEMIETEHGPRLVPTPCAPPTEGDNAHADAFEVDEPDVDEATRSVRVVVRAHHSETGANFTHWRGPPADLPVYVEHEPGIRIGSAAGEGVRGDGGLRMRLTFDRSTIAERVWQGIRGGTLRGISPGWRELPESPRKALLREVSVCALPMHADSLVHRRRLAQPRAMRRSDAGAVSGRRLDAREIVAALARAEQVARQRLAAAPESEKIATTQSAHAEVGGIDRFSRTATVIASSTQTINGEAITSWDLDRYMRNPVILWSHDSLALPIGVATEVAFDQTGGLRMKIRFATEEANPLAEQVWQCLAQGILRGVSVGFVPLGRGAARLIEASIVSVPADDSALVSEATESDDGEQRRARVSSAGRELASARKRFFAACSECGAPVDTRAGKCTECNKSIGDRADGMEDNMSSNGSKDMIESARRTRDQWAASAWRGPASAPAKATATAPSNRRDSEDGHDDEVHVDAGPDDKDDPIVLAKARQQAAAARAWRTPIATSEPAGTAAAARVDASDEDDPIALAKKRQQLAAANAWRSTDAQRFGRAG